MVQLGANRDGIGVHHQPVGVPDVLLELRQGLALAEHAGDLLQPADIPVLVDPVLQGERLAHCGCLPLLRYQTASLGEYTGISDHGGKMEQLPAWGPVRRTLFRFLFSYLVLYSFPSPLHTFPVYGEILRDSYREIWNTVVPWVGEHVLGTEV